jgi:uroporphyrinogen decarboxylase
MLRNDLLLKALRQEDVSRPPVWMMRQAGRYLPEYIALRKKYDFFTRVQTPELACEITLQPIDIVGTDAAIIFSDILVIPQALGMEVLMEEGKGPSLPQTIQTQKDVDALQVAEAADHLQYVYDALSLTKRELNGRVPLIGFAGAPFTILCYMVEGKGSKGFEKAKAFCFTRPDLAAALLQKITDATIQYLIRQAKAGADVVQVFDSWSGLLSPDDFDRFAAPNLLQIAEAVSAHAPVILFPKGSNYALSTLSMNKSVSGIGIDWTIRPAEARAATQHRVTLQGNFDPAKLLLSPAEIHQEVRKMIDGFGVKGYIANLGHGITPNIPVDHAKAFVNAVKEYEHVVAH